MQCQVRVEGLAFSTQGFTSARIDVNAVGGEQARIEFNQTRIDLGQTSDGVVLKPLLKGKAITPTRYFEFELMLD